MKENLDIDNEIETFSELYKGTFKFCKKMKREEDLKHQQI